MLPGFKHLGLLLSRIEDVLYRFVFNHWISRLDAEKCHNATMKTLHLISQVPGLTSLLRVVFSGSVGSLSGGWVGNAGGLKGLARPVPGYLGLAAGMDKDALAPAQFAAFGFAFVEVGTVTPRPQPGNDKPRLWRILPLRAVRNRMGFNNRGAEEMARRLHKLRSSRAGRSLVLGVNLGKNKTTDLNDAVEDYRISACLLAKYADYLVINVSSPNTPGLRSLQSTQQLRQIAQAVITSARKSANREVPVLVKLAPDLEDAQLIELADLVKEVGLAGVIATNTTINHDFGEGGLSGAPLKERALQVVRLLRAQIGEDYLIIGCGGIEDAASAREFLDAGADLLEAFTAMIYQGPSFAGRINKQLSADLPALPLRRAGKA
ncbi:quinone-dependent dihydroorotate dehydrogenase [uncultured Varibaculum sp.]|uniref:quinone-dependent dihydroorotate dehydrogenase n=1 Tax=uncultured Varibaculum sp. TaxID=413896 RepID=UPI0026770CFC|nr:quinone-dependent dihydroorotate dehydrogenase [uncultured Varibaculum sp.]